MPGPIYKPMHTEKREIRILVLCPSRRSNSRLKCELIHVDLDALADAQFEHYEAVSYTWGDASDTKRIELNGYTFSITKNLHALLKRLRNKRLRGYYWVDAMCIDQGNIPERGQQVQLMKAIYENAEQVLVWLGPSRDDSDIAMDLMDEITDADEGDQEMDADAQIERGVELLQRSLTDPNNRHKWEALARLFQRPWWKRVWIRQEVAVASQIVVLCGDNRLQRWSTLVSAVEYLNRVASLFQPFVRDLGGQSSGYSDAITLDTLQEQVMEDGFVDEETLFFHGRSCEATDFRDRIFGLVGLADPETRAAIVPNYELSGQDVFVMATKHLLARGDTLDCLSASHGCIGDHSLPSWVIDFTADWPQVPLRFKEDQENLYSAAGTISRHISFLEQSSHQVLCMKGILIGKIADTSLGYLEEEDETFISQTTTVSRLELLEACWNSWHISGNPNVIHEIMQPWFHTIVADQDDNGDRASNTYINDTFLKSDWQASSAELNFEIIDETCQRYCTSVPLVSNHLLNRHLFLINSGHLGLGPRGLAKDDIVCVIYGCGVPIILRPTQSGDFLLVGEAYVHSMMDGEAIESSNKYRECVFRVV
jgi:hypothetical protein